MGWLRSEDLKEEKNVTASIRSIAGEDFLQFGAPRRITNCSERNGMSFDRAGDMVNKCNGDFQQWQEAHTKE